MAAEDLHQKPASLLEIKSKCINSSSRNILWKKVMKTRRNPTRNNAIKMVKRKRARCAAQDGSRRLIMIEKKVRTLKNLIPRARSSVGLDGLFKETAEYISNLQMRVRIMQDVVNALSNSESV